MQAQMSATVAGVLAGETPYMPHLHKRNKIGVIFFICVNQSENMHT